ncbi:MAG TPA: translocation/assembly module TamB domain-containing protein [Allocoleopsis sp.]
MTNSPNPGNEPEPNLGNESQPASARRSRRRQQRRLWLVLGFVVLAGLGGGATWVWFFIQRQLAPMVEQNVAGLLKRPVNLGNVESFSLTGLRFGPSELPATSTDRDRADVKAVEVSYNPVQLLLNRTLNLDVTLVKPDVYIEQDEDRRWVNLNIQRRQPGPIKVNLKVLRLRDADVVLVPRSQAGKLQKPVPAQVPEGKARFLNDNRVIQFDLDGQLVAGGKFQVQGEGLPPTGEINVAVTGNDLNAPEVSRLIQIPLTLQTGLIQSNLEVKLQPKKPVQLLGTAMVQNVTARVAALPQPFINSNGLLRFKGTTIRLENVKALFGQIPAVANGQLDTQSNFDLSAQTQPVALKQVLQTFKIEKLPVAASAQVLANLRVTGPIAKPVIDGSFRTTQPAQIDRVTFRSITADFGLVSSILTVNHIRATPTFGGLVTGQGKAQLVRKDVNFNFQTADLSGQALAKIYNLKLPVPLGPVSGQAQIVGSLNTPQTIRTTGAATVNAAGGTLTASNIQAVGVQRFTAQVQASGLRVERLTNVPPQFRGPLSANLTLSGPIANLNLSAVRGSGTGSLQVAGGTVTARNIQLANGRFTTQVQARGLQSGRLAQVPPQFQGPISGNLTLSGTLANLSPSTVRGTGSGSLQIAGGTVTATNIQLANGRFTTPVQARGLQSGRLAQVPPQFQGPISGNLILSGALANLSPSTVRGTGSGSLQVAGGTVTATNIQLANGQFQAVVAPMGVRLASFSQNLQGRLTGRLNVSGALNAINPAAIRASGQVNFSQGLSLIDRPLTASITWNGQQLQIARATADGFQASGVVNVNLANQGLQAVQGLDLNVQAKDLNLQQLPIKLPNAVTVAGRADFDGRISGTPTAPNASGNLQLRNFVAGGLQFEPLLTGQVSAVGGQGANLQLAGNKDQIQVALGADYKPISFSIQRGDAIARGTRQGDLLLVNAQNFPIALLKNITPLPSAIASQPLAGQLSGDLRVNVNTYGISGNIAIANPIIGTLRGESLSSSFQYENGAIVFNNGVFKQGDGQYLLSGRLIPTASGPQFQGQLQVEQGKLQSILTALQVFDITDLTRGFNAPVYGKADNVTVSQAGLPQSPLQDQLRRLSEIQSLLAQRQQQAEASPLPPLADATGTFTGTVNIAGSLASGITAQFDIQGQDWKWGPYSAQQVIAQGGFQNGVLTLLPLRFQSPNPDAPQNAQDPEQQYRSITFSGTIGGEAQSGQLRVRNIPIAQLQEAFNLPPAVGFTGELNATATLAGSMNNPQARGVVTLTDATLNNTPVESAQGSFSYSNARLNFGSTVVIAQAEAQPLNVSGSVPYKLPFASVAPADNQLALNIDVHNEGLAFLNLLSGGQVSWVNGTGDVQLKVSGTINPNTNRPSQLTADGVATVADATIQASALPQPLTHVNGKVLFDLDRIQVEDVQGQFSDGIVTAAGTLPLSQPIPQDNPLTVKIGDLAFNLKGLYKGRVQGDVQIAGTALNPKLSGQLNLFNGEIQLAGAGAATGGSASTGSGASTGGERESGAAIPIEFDGLKLALGRDIRITQAPILSFVADGTLVVNGSLAQPRPEGTIQLERGQVNLFTTQFRLARDYNNTAQFVRERGLDPVLDVRLTASVAEATQRRLPTDPLSAEISDAPTFGTFGLGSVQTVRVQARVQGPASRLLDPGSLELTSNPPRSEAEIVALIGGGFIDTLGRGDTTLGLANLAGSALLSNVQNAIGDALGLSEFRLSPTIIRDDNRRTSSLGLTAEAGVDINRQLSVSLLKELTTNQPFQYSLRYRLNDKTLLRGFTDLSGDSGAIVEYETRF